MEKRKLKVCISHYGVKDGAGFSRSYQIAKELSILGHDIVLITCQNKDFLFPYYKEKRDGVNLVSFPDIVPNEMKRTGFGLLSIFLKVLYVLSNKFDIVQSDAGHRPNSGIPCLLNKYIRKSIYISEWWDNFGKEGQYKTRPLFQKITIGIYDLLFEIFEKRFADGIICLSHYTKKRALAARLKKDKIIIVNGGCDVRNIKYYPDTMKKEKFKIPKDSLTFGFIGINKIEKEDLLDFFCAFSQLTELKINILTTGIYLNTDFKEQYNLNKRIYEFGWLDYRNFAEVISCVDVFLLIQEENKQNLSRWPNKLGDYWATGRPVLTNLWGENTYYKDIDYLFLYVKKDVNEINKMIVKLYNNRNSIHLNNNKIRLFGENMLSWEQQTIKIENFYYNIINNRANK